jgi:hypothetical protein
MDYHYWVVWDLYYWATEYGYEIERLGVIESHGVCRIAPRHLYLGWIKENPKCILLNDSVQKYLDGLQ